MLLQSQFHFRSQQYLDIKRRRHFCCAVGFVSNRASLLQCALNRPLIRFQSVDWCLMQFSLRFTRMQTVGVVTSWMARWGLWKAIFLVLPSVAGKKRNETKSDSRASSNSDCFQLTSIGPNNLSSDTFWSSESFSFLFFHLVVMLNSFNGHSFSLLILKSRLFVLNHGVYQHR